MSELIRCKQCRWWVGECDDEPSYKQCQHPKVDKLSPDGFGSYDGEPYGGGVFVTGPEFGCVHGEVAVENY